MNVSVTPEGEIFRILPLATLLGTYRYPSFPKTDPFGVLIPLANILVTPVFVIFVIVDPLYLEANILPSLSIDNPSSKVERGGTTVDTSCEKRFTKQVNEIKTMVKIKLVIFFILILLFNK